MGVDAGNWAQGLKKNEQQCLKAYPAVSSRNMYH